MSGYPLFIPEFVLCTNSSLFWFKIANELREFRNYLKIKNTRTWDNLSGFKPPLHRRPSFISRKAEPYHGLGLSFLDRIANEAGGRIDVVLKDDLFCVLILIPLKKTDNVNPVQQEESDETN